MADTLAAALSELHSRLPRITKGETAEVPTKTGGKYSYRYASLASIHEAVFPLLRELGLLWVCKPTLRDDGQFVLAYTLLHIPSGEAETGEYPLGTGAPQAIGSAITYGRRYLICCLLGIVPDEDDDGQLAQAAHEQAVSDWRAPANPRTRKADRSRGPWENDPWAGSPPEDQPNAVANDDRLRARLHAAFSRAKINGRDDRLAYAMSKLDLPELKTSNALSARQALELVAHLEAEVQD